MAHTCAPLIISGRAEGMETEQETKQLESGENENNGQTQSHKSEGENTLEQVYDDRVPRFRTGIRA